MDGSAQPDSTPRLPPEIRLQIFSRLIRFEGELQRRTTLTAELYKKGELQSESAPSISTQLRSIDTSLFVVSKTLHQEVLDCFYHVNTFKIHYNQLCTCHGSFRYPAFDHKRVKSLHVYDFCPRDGVRLCPMCDHAGLGLTTFLNSLPKLRLARVSFEDYISINDFVKAARKEPSIDLSAIEFGAFSMICSPLRIEMCLPLMSLAWRRLAEVGGDGDENSRVPLPGGEETLRHGLEYLQFEAEDWKRIPLSLRPYFVEEESDGLIISRLRIKNVTAHPQAMLDFTLTMAEVCIDLLSGEGTDCIEWLYLAGMVDAVCWDFKEAFPSLITPDSHGSTQLQP